MLTHSFKRTMILLIVFLVCALILRLIAYNQCCAGKISDTAYYVVASSINFAVNVTLNNATTFDWLIACAIGCILIADVKQYLER